MFAYVCAYASISLVVCVIVYAHKHLLARAHKLQKYEYCTPVIQAG